MKIKPVDTRENREAQVILVPIAHGLTSAARVTVWQMVSACYRIAPAAETGTLRSHMVTQNSTFAACKSVVTMKRAESLRCAESPGRSIRWPNELRPG